MNRYYGCHVQTEVLNECSCPLAPVILPYNISKIQATPSAYVPEETHRFKRSKAYTTTDTTKPDQVKPNLS